MITKSISLMVVSIAIAGCAMDMPGAIAPAEVSSIPRRDFTATEKAALSKSLAVALKDPSSAQFRWMPVLLREREGHTDYCGFVNGKNSYGGYNGFELFWAKLRKGPGGQFVGGSIAAMGSPGDAGERGATAKICIDYGYGDAALSVAKP